MGTLIKQSIRRPVAVLMAVLAIVVFGAVSVMNTPMTLIPDMNLPMLVISTSYSGAGPSEVDSLVTQPLESTLSSLSGVQSVTSTSSEGSSVILLQYDFGTDMTEASAEVRDRLEMVTGFLPEDTSDPLLIKMNMDQAPIVTMSVTSDAIDETLATVEDVVVPEFERIAGVASVDVSGGTRYDIVIEVDDNVMTQYGLSMSSITSAVSGADLNLPAGYLDFGEKSLFLRSENQILSVQDVESIPIQLRTGDVIHLSDIADISEVAQESSSISRINGQNNIGISISQQQDANTLTVSAAVSDVVEELSSQGYNFEISVTMDQGELILDTLLNVLYSLLLGAALAILILWFFLSDWKAALIISLSIPISVIVTFVLIYFADISINMVSMGGLVVGVGMMVDNAIVVLESMFRCRNDGMKYVPAAETGAKMVSGAVVASTLTTVVVFLPIVFMGGMSSELLSQAGLTIAFALLASLISALTLVPCLFVRLHPKTSKEVTVADKVMAKITDVYTRALRWALAHTKSVVAISIGALLISLSLLLFIGMELMPAMDEGQFSIDIELEEGLKIEAIDEYLLIAEEVVAGIPDVESYTATGSAGGSSMGMMSMGGGGTSASIAVVLTDDREISTEEAANMARDALQGIPGCKITVTETNSTMMGGGSNSAVVNIESRDDIALEQSVEMLMAEMANIEGIVSVSSDMSAGRPEARLEVDEVKAASYGLTPVMITSAVNQKVSGVTAANITRDGEEVAVKVQYPEGRYDTISDLRSMTITNQQGQDIPLVEVAEIVMDAGPSTITREGGDRIVSVTGQVVGRDYSFVVRDVNTMMESIQLPAGVSFYTNEDQMNSMTSEFTSLAMAGGLSILLVFMVMACQFESLRFPLVVMSAVPLAAIGALLGLFITGTTLNMISIIGLIVLVGIVVNNAIVLIDCVGQLRNQGVGLDESLEQAGRLRLRPILMTTLTTVLGQFPLSLGIGTGGQMLQSMAVVIMGGLIVSTVLTLVVVPVLYKRSDKQSRKTWKPIEAKETTPDENYENITESER